MKIVISKFRALRNVEVEFASAITVICGKNGTAKSSILGIAAQVFSFDKDYTTDTRLLYKTVMEGSFKSQFTDHFRVSPQFDGTGSMEVGVHVRDGYTSRDATGELTITRRGSMPRAVVRNNSTAPEGANRDRNFTHPVVYLSLKRLYPIAHRSEYKEKEFPYLSIEKNAKEFVDLTNELLGKQVGKLTGTTGTVTSAVSHGDTYDCHSVSAGEDNAGQIVAAIMSFRKLKEESGINYKGGMLLIDEADAGLFPAAQRNLINILDRECKNLSLQVIMTSHSISLIETIHERAREEKTSSRFKTVYLTDSFGPIAVRNDWDWSRIFADINVQPISIGGLRAPKVNVYFEDKEGVEFFKALTFRHQANKLLNMFHDVSLGCSNYINLVKRGVPEFKDRSIICLDADAKEQAQGLGAIVILPGKLPPDQLIFEYLYNKPADDTIWKNPIQYSRSVFLDDGREVVHALSITGATTNLAKAITSYRGTIKLRELFKAFYKKDNFQLFLRGKSGFNPWKQWIEENAEERRAFIVSFVDRLKYILKHQHGLGNGELGVLDS